MKKYESIQMQIIYLDGEVFLKTSTEADSENLLPMVSPFSNDFNS